MPDVRVRVNDQVYSLTCGEGEQERVEKLAAYLDGHVKQVAKNVGQIGDIRLFLLASLNVCDELFSAREQLSNIGPVEDDAVAAMLNDTAARIEKCAETLNASLNGDSSPKDS